VHRLEWKKQARQDLISIIEYIAEDSPDNADKLADEIEDKAKGLLLQPEIYRAGRMRGTREMVARPHYIGICRVKKDLVEILRVKHTAQQWPGSR
jgi:addiction module RelE/StbE family toxin